MDTMGCLPTLKRRSLCVWPAANAAPANPMTATNLRAHFAELIPILPNLLAATVHSQFIQHLLLLVSVDQHLLRVNVVRVVFQGLFGIPNEGVCLIQVRAIARNLRRRT